MKNQSGNNLLYVLSEKRSMRLYDCRKHMDDLWQKGEGERYWYYSIIRKLSSLGYLDIGEYSGKTIVQIAPPVLVALPFMRPTFFLTGARSPKLLRDIEKICNHSEMELEKKQFDNNMPESLFIKIYNTDKMECLFKDLVQEGRLKIEKQPISWNIINFSKGVEEYKESLENDYFSADPEDIMEVFDPASLRFTKPDDKSELPLAKDNKNQEFLIKSVNHYDKYYLYSQNKKEKVATHLDWGKFLMLQNSKNPILKLTKEMELKSCLRLPPLLERGLALLSGTPVNEVFFNNKKDFVFTNVPLEIAKLVSEKLGQNKNIQRMD